MLHIDVSGHSRSRLVLVHGFTQTGRSWRPLTPALAQRHQVVAVDCPGHGLSSHIRTGLWEGARKLGEVGNEAAYLGYSMGGRLALHLALAAPYLVRRLVLVGATAARKTRRTRRVEADEELARASRARWPRRLPGAVVGESALRHAARDDADLAARWRTPLLGWRLRCLTGTGRQESLWDRLAEVTVPALFVAGEADTKFTDLAQRLASSGRSRGRRHHSRWRARATLEQPGAPRCGRRLSRTGRRSRQGESDSEQRRRPAAPVRCAREQGRASDRSRRGTIRITGTATTRREGSPATHGPRSATTIG